MVSLLIKVRGLTIDHTKDNANMTNKFREIENYISANRLAPYMDYCGHNTDKALHLYQMNLRLSGAFLPLVSMLEVALRNKIDSILEAIYPELNNKNWLQILHDNITNDISQGIIQGREFGGIKGQLNKVIGGVTDKVDQNITNYLKREYRKVRKADGSKLTQDEIDSNVKRDFQSIKSSNGYLIKKNVMIAKANFALWTSFFDSGPYRYLNGMVIRAFNFQSLPTSENNRRKVSNMMYDIRKFRNRISHNESIIFQQQRFAPNYPLDIKSKILLLLELLSENLSLYAEDIYRVNRDIQEISDYCTEISSLVTNED